MNVRILEGDCLSVMPTLDTDSIDAVVCDPPYGLKFMGKEWDHGVPGVPFWTEALRVAQPGAYLLAFGGTRTHHRLTCAIEDAGWEIRDCLMWLYGSGFPKSHDISKAIDKAAGAERTVVGKRAQQGNGGQLRASLHYLDLGEGKTIDGRNTAPATEYRAKESFDLTAPATDAARQWEGWGTALKPAWEPIILARKPFASTVAANVQEHGTGALNIDGCRIESPETAGKTYTRGGNQRGHSLTTNTSGIHEYIEAHPSGRWPANLILDEISAALVDEQTGTLVSGKVEPHHRNHGKADNNILGKFGGDIPIVGYGDSGGASRFFYTAKASRAERGEGNKHPTVKPLDLMQWLCRLVTPKGGLILDPFCGSGTTGRAAVAEGFQFVGIELSPEYAAIARARIAEYAPLFGDVA